MSDASGIKTTYKGIHMRSRAEARWAAFFDIVGWEWVYEPLDFKGYIPDFVLKFPAGHVLVEVKGGTTCGKEALLLASPKLDSIFNDWVGEVLVLPAAPSLDSKYSLTGGAIGRLSQRSAADASWEWGHAELFYCLKCKRVSLFHDSLAWRCQVNGCWDGKHYLGDWDGLRPAWARATNNLQWRTTSLTTMDVNAE